MCLAVATMVAVTTGVATTVRPEAGSSQEEVAMCQVVATIVAVIMAVTTAAATTDLPVVASWPEEAAMCLAAATTVVITGDKASAGNNRCCLLLAKLPLAHFWSLVPDVRHQFLREKS